MQELNFTPFPELETERLLLRNLTNDDVQDIFEIRGNPATMQYIPHPVAKYLDEAQMVIDKITGFTASNEKLNWAMIEKASGKLIGIIGYPRFNMDSYRAEVGYVLNKEYERKGFTQEALSAVLGYGFEQMGLHSIEAVIRAENIASMKLIEKLNFTKNGRFKDYIFFDGKFYDAVIYSLVKE